MWPTPSDRALKSARLCLANLPSSDLPQSGVQAAHRGLWFIRKTGEKSKMDRPSLRKSGGSAGRWQEFMLLPFSWLQMRLRSLKECKKVAWGFEKHGRDFEETRWGRNNKKWKRSWHAFEVECPPKMFLSSFSYRAFEEKGFASGEHVWCGRTPYQLKPFQKLFYHAVRSPRHSFHLPPPTPQRRVEKVISKALPPCSSMNCPREFITLVSVVEGQASWRPPCGTKPPAYSQVSHSSTSRLALHLMWWEGAGSAGMHLPYTEGPWGYQCVYLWLQWWYWLKNVLSENSIHSSQHAPACICVSTMKTWGKPLATNSILYTICAVWECLGLTVPTSSTIVSV